MKVSITSEESSDELYGSNAKGATCLLLHQKLIASQALQVEKFLKEGALLQEEHCKLAEESNPKELLPDILSKRMDEQETKSKKSKVQRVMDDVEVSIMAVLDSDGIITVKSRLTEFMSLMTRIDKMEHRALCLHILSKNLSDTCEHDFVLEGGYRLLKQWVKRAQEQKCIKELKSILKLLNKLPYYADKLLSCNFGPEFKSLKAFADGALKVQTQSLIEDLKKRPPVPEGPKSGNNTTPVSLTPAQREMEASMREKMVKEVEPIAAVSPSTSPTAAKSINMKVVSVNKTEAKPSSPSESKGVGLSVVKAGAPTTVAPTKETATVTPGASNPVASASTATVSVAPTSTPAPPNRPVKRVDMGAIARKAADEENKRIQQEKRDALANAAKPGKGGMKRSYTDANGAGKAGTGDKRARPVKRSIRWADSEGGELKEVRTFYVEGLRSSTTKHKDAAAAEKRFEREARTAHRKDTMQKKCEWNKPAKLGWLGEVEEIQQICNDSFESPESDIIKARLEITPDASYPDVTLIPDDPDEPDGDCEKTAVKGEPVKYVEVVFNSGPVGGKSSANEEVFQPLGATDRNSPHAVLASVPEQLHFIEYAVLERLAVDATQIGPLLNFDGSVNMQMVNAYRSHVLGPNVPPMMVPPPPPMAARGSRFSAPTNNHYAPPPSYR